ncbi:valine--tRNA ligase-like isoform X1 [Daktulosphaira vitifoliae]|uniref:valine--tRNA ligase-like isoform X1 n=2 Tax=Daktulosphaira vitifoliae TaxID=58002 RepID=UPI0021A99583|nr:valine--tRNA ligase-like isoform X1 [Daktulosphaira vitifoliae]
MHIILLRNRYFKSPRTIGCVFYSIDFKYGENQILPPKYDPKFVEISKNISSHCTKSKLSIAYSDIFSMILPPPNITGSLHLGHALTATVQDVISRWYRMNGVNVVWVPGTDHAGIATQVVVEKKLHAEKKVSRHDLGRDAFNNEIMKWKNEKKRVIKNQLVNLGVTLNWDREFFTMDNKQNKAVNEAIIRLFDDQLLYRKKSLVNWCCTLQSTVSDIEIDYQEIPGKTYIAVPGYQSPVEFGVLTDVAYKLYNSDQEIVVSTTRPETILGDVALAVHPEDGKYKGLIGTLVWHPFRKCTIPIIVDSSVDKNFGTGVVKVTPAHDIFDYELAIKHNLPIKSVIDESGRINFEDQEFDGLPRYEARKAIINRLKNMNLLRGFCDHKMLIPVCSRTRDVIEYIPKLQWFINCKNMAQKSSVALRNRDLVIEPKHYHNQWFSWLDNSKDWCVSRQLWWGHRLPLFESKYGWIAAHSVEEALEKLKNKMQLSTKEVNELKIKQDEDVLDTWFSSALLPFSSFGWPEKSEDFKRYYPLSVMETGHDILTFWVARMVMLGLHLTGSLPFKKVILHGMIRDAHGRKMSKSVGNVIEPDDIIQGISIKDLQEKVKISAKSGLISVGELEKALVGQRKMFPNGIKECGTDALRLTLVSHNIKNQVIHFDLNECYRNRMFCNKIWQASRFVLMWAIEKRVIEYDSPKPITVTQQWILSRLADTVLQSNAKLKNYDIYIATTKIRKFFYNDFCDIFLEMCKPTFQYGSELEIKTACEVLLYTLDTSFRLIHPIMPFLTKTLYNFLPGKQGKYLEYPKSSEYADWCDKKLDDEMIIVKDVITAIRRVRSINNFNKDQSEIILITKHQELLKKFEDIIQNLCGSKSLCFMNKNEIYNIQSITDFVEDHTEIHLLLKGNSLEYKKYYSLLNLRRQRLDKQIAKAEKTFFNENCGKFKICEDQETRDNKLYSLKKELERVNMYINTLKNKKKIEEYEV